MNEHGIGKSVRRVEDDRLVRGLGRYTDDLAFPRQVHMAVVRSMHAAARIDGINTDAASAMPGVVAVLTGADALADRLGTFSSLQRRTAPGGGLNFEPPYRVLAAGETKFMGEPLVIVLAETLQKARDAAEAVVVQCDPRPAVTGTIAATADDAPTVRPQAPGNVCFVHDQGDESGIEQAFARAAYVAAVDLVTTRVTAAPIEPRAAIGVWDAGASRYTLYAGVQSPHGTRAELAHRILKVPEGQLRVVAHDVGGAFGLKGMPHPELGLVLWAARRVGRPVRWVADRSESFAGDHHARDAVSRAELALDADRRFLGLRIRHRVNLGAFLTLTGINCALNNLGGVAGVYVIPAIHASVEGVFSNTSPTSAYRGAGRPEASYMIERVIDAAARDIGMDPAELRLRNLIPPSAMPYDTGFAFTYDSGEFEANQRRVMEMADWTGFERRRAEAAARGALRGIGMAHVIESAGGIPHEMAEIRFNADGSVKLAIGTHSQGQSHETTYRQLMSGFLGLEPELVRVESHDSDATAFGIGAGGSRSMIAASMVVRRVADKIIEKARPLAAHLLEADGADIEFADGGFRVVGTDRAVALTEVARASFRLASLPAGVEAGLQDSALVAINGPTFPNGCHICEVEIDRQTGACLPVGYWSVEDVGRMVNPMVVKGQMQGGIAQGLGQVFGEAVQYDADSGQLLTGSFMDYRMPRAADMPPIELAANEVLTTKNPLGVKGAGEAGTVGALSAAMNAVCDALRPLGIRHFDMPATPNRLWQAMRAADERER